MKTVKYLGPDHSVNVGGHGRHRKDEEKPYPDDVADSLIRDMKTNRFEIVGTGSAADLESTTENTEDTEKSKENALCAVKPSVNSVPSVVKKRKKG